MPLKILLNGAHGRMGKAVQEAAAESDCEIVAAIDTGDDASKFINKCQVAIDFSAPEGTIGLARLAAANGAALVIGTTGHTDKQKAAINEVVWNVPTVWTGNFSVGVNLLFYLTRKAAEALGSDYNAEIIEMHHRMKKDAPSGTADQLLEVLREARGLKRRRGIRHGRRGMVGERPENEIGVHAVRGGDVVGEHTVIFAGPGERVELAHKAGDRVIFAQGALRAAQWVVDQRPGVYDMQDVLGLRD